MSDYYSGHNAEARRNSISMSAKKTVPIRDGENKVAAYQNVADLDDDPGAPDQGAVDGHAGREARAPSPQGVEEASITLAEDLEAARREAKESYDRLLRVGAEFENYKKRASREVEEFRKYANEQLLRELLPVIDNLERALAVCDAEADGAAGIRQGVELTLKDMYKLLERFFVRPVEAEGKPFDPAFHEAMMQEPTDEVPENTVVRSLQKGYTIHDRLLRPAMVVVAKASPPAGGASPAADATDAQS